MNRQNLLLNMFNAMLDALGPSRWWPGDTPFEVAVGAILTQNAAWINVERAIGNLKSASVLDPETLYALPEERLAELVRPAGYFRLKASRLKHFLAFLKNECAFNLNALAAFEVMQARDMLLGVKGIGPETADSILLYACEMPVFVVDAYTGRILSRHGLIPEETDYAELQAFFMDILPEDVKLFNEFHALLVRVGKDFCKRKAGLCRDCPLGSFLE
jgi:endonuclease III related protein